MKLSRRGFIELLATIPVAGSALLALPEAKAPLPAVVTPTGLLPHNVLPDVDYAKVEARIASGVTKFRIGGKDYMIMGLRGYRSFSSLDTTSWYDAERRYVDTPEDFSVELYGHCRSLPDLYSCELTEFQVLNSLYTIHGRGKLVESSYSGGYGGERTHLRFHLNQDVEMKYYG